MTDPADAALLMLIRSHGAPRALALLTPIAPARVLRRAEQLARIERAGEMLRERVPRAAIAARLATSGCSKATAYRAIDAALARATVSQTPGR